MYKNTLYVPEVEINLNPGVYVFDSEPATGKTRLCKHLKLLRAYGEPVASLTYNDILTGMDMTSVFNPGNVVIMLDRYTMYSNLGHDLMNAMRNESIILVDCKDGFIEGCDTEDCCIEMTENKIKVFCEY